MKLLAIIVLAVIAMVFCGWLTFRQTDGSASVTLHKNEVKSDTKAAVEKGEELIDAAVEEGRDLIGKPKSEGAEAIDKPAAESVPNTAVIQGE